MGTILQQHRICVKDSHMKKTIALLLLLSTFPLFALSFTPSVNLEHSELHNPIYLELKLSQDIEILTLDLIYVVGHDFEQDIAYNTLLLQGSVNFNWGSVIVSNKFGSENMTKVRIQL